jgi:hypothetical protein
MSLSVAIRMYKEDMYTSSGKLKEKYGNEDNQFKSLEECQEINSNIFQTVS